MLRGDEHVDELDPVAHQHRDVAADRHAAVVEHPVPEPPAPVEQLAPRPPAGEVVDGGGVGIGRDQVEEGHGADPGRDRAPPRRAVTLPPWLEEGTAPRRSIAALLANLGIAVAKFVGFVITGSASMLAESIHSVADSGNQGLLLLGGRRARREADEAHPFGYGRERYFWAFIVALVLFSLGGAFAIFEGIEKIRHPHEIESAGVAIGILLFAIVLETFSFRTAIVESNKVRGDASVVAVHPPVEEPRAAGRAARGPRRARSASFIALGAVTASLVTDDPLYDGIGTLLDRHAARPSSPSSSPSR